MFLNLMNAIIDRTIFFFFPHRTILDFIPSRNVNGITPTDRKERKMRQNAVETKRS